MTVRCKFCGHVSTQHPDNMDGEGCCKTIGCFCRARRQIIERIERLSI